MYPSSHEQKKLPVVWCGDFNAARGPMDIYKGGLTKDKLSEYGTVVVTDDELVFTPKKDLTGAELTHSKTLEKKLFLTLLYPTASFLFLLSLYNEFGIESLLWLLMVVAGADVGAYFVGKGLGKHKFCETSPNKTWEGVAGGMIVAALLGTFFALDALSIWGALFVSVIVAFASVFGDLFESYLKRVADVKDSGNILPGHGGILDRTDGYLFGGIIMLVLLRAMI